VEGRLLEGAVVEVEAAGTAAGGDDRRELGAPSATAVYDTVS
jgi:hypothetical protein